MKRVWLGFGVLLVLLLAACGGQAPAGNGGNGDDGSSGVPVVEPQDVAEVLSAANSQLYRLEQPLSALVPVPTLGLAPFAVGIAPLDTADWDCSPVTVTGDASDPDNDGIPVNATYNGKCTWSYSGSGGSFAGYWEYENVNVQDPDSDDPQAGVKVKGKVEWGITSTASSVASTWTITQHDLVKQGDDYKFDYVGNWVVTADGDTYSFNYDLSGTWTPDDMDDPWGDGTVNAEGRFGGSSSSCATGWSFSVNLSGVHLTADKIDAGTANYSGTDCDGDTTTVSVTWSATEVCITTDGNTVCVPNN